MNLHSQPVLAQGSIEKLQAYDWPGNVRELENLVEGELIRIKNANTPLSFEDISELQSKREMSIAVHHTTSSIEPLDLDSAMRSHIIHALQLTNGKIQGRTGAAALIGLHPSTLKHRLRKLGIPFGRIVHFEGQTRE